MILNPMQENIIKSDIKKGSSTKEIADKLKIPESLVENLVKESNLDSTGTMFS